MQKRLGRNIEKELRIFKSPLLSLIWEWADQGSYALMQHKMGWSIFQDSIWGPLRNTLMKFIQKGE